MLSRKLCSGTNTSPVIAKLCRWAHLLQSDTSLSDNLWAAQAMGFWSVLQSYLRAALGNLAIKRYWCVDQPRVHQQPATSSNNDWDPQRFEVEARVNRWLIHLLTVPLSDCLSVFLRLPGVPMQKWDLFGTQTPFLRYHRSRGSTFLRLRRTLLLATLLPQPWVDLPLNGQHRTRIWI